MKRWREALLMLFAVLAIAFWLVAMAYLASITGPSACNPAPGWKPAMDGC